MTGQLEKAEQQLLGFHSAKQGDTLIDLVRAMGLGVGEWEKMKKTGMVFYLGDDAIREIDNYFIKKMVGTEFIYVFSDRSEIKAVVAAFDPEIGFTCLATSLVDSLGADHSRLVDENGNFCLMGCDAYQLNDDGVRHIVLFTLKSIRCLGYYKVDSDGGLGYTHNGGQASCSF